MVHKTWLSKIKTMTEIKNSCFYDAFVFVNFLLSCVAFGFIGIMGIDFVRVESAVQGFSGKHD